MWLWPVSPRASVVNISAAYIWSMQMETLPESLAKIFMDSICCGHSQPTHRVCLCGYTPNSPSCVCACVPGVSLHVCLSVCVFAFCMLECVCVCFLLGVSDSCCGCVSVSICSTTQPTANSSSTPPHPHPHSPPFLFPFFLPSHSIYRSFHPSIPRFIPPSLILAQ